MTSDELREKLRAHINKNYGSMAEAGRTWGVSTAFVSMVVSGSKRPNQAMLDDMGFERVEVQDTYRKKKAAKT